MSRDIVYNNSQAFILLKSTNASRFWLPHGGLPGTPLERRSVRERSLAFERRVDIALCFSRDGPRTHERLENKALGEIQND